MDRLTHNFREKIFWFVDKLKGGKVRKHFAEIKEKIENRAHFKDDAAPLSNLLRHVTNTVPFYKDFKERSFHSFPIVDKNLIKNNKNQFLSDKFSDKTRVENTTSGSTGTPFSLYKDFNKILRNYADTIYFANKAGYFLGEKLVFLRIWSNLKRKNPLNKWMQNMVTFDVLLLNDNQIKKLFNKLEKYNSKIAFLGYASALDQIARYVVKNNISDVNFEVSSVIAM